ncbi:K02A2.6-like [Cordylochernes scorpioides]|uniref:K02A2.6-like n=1 Tax=Cordylochernes scorpioides TaxID=51811 RepID=A0ABY6K546_9ARAC|nr:K02A2.6-like [Cordylochernes scorpioides]
MLTEGLPAQWKISLAPIHFEDIETWVEDLKKKGLVRDSRSPWAFPVTLVPKADGQKRLCVDYRRLNALTIDDKMPLPNIQEVIDRLQGAKYFTSLDIASGYWHVEMAPDSTEKTAFITNEGLYECHRIPQIWPPGEGEKSDHTSLRSHLDPWNI